MQGLQNLLVVMVEFGQLGQARNCLLQARTIAPTQDFITKHLDIVMTNIAEMQHEGPNAQHTNHSKCLKHSETVHPIMKV